MPQQRSVDDGCRGPGGLMTAVNLTRCRSVADTVYERCFPLLHLPPPGSVRWRPRHKAGRRNAGAEAAPDTAPLTATTLWPASTTHDTSRQRHPARTTRYPRHPARLIWPN
ncbi:hypothetical protein ACOMHN_057111 [Nucella lapillus]